MHSFSDEDHCKQQSYKRYVSRQSYTEMYGRTMDGAYPDTDRRTPSPPDSGVDTGSSSSPNGSPRDGSGGTDSIQQTIAKLAAKSELLVKPEVSTKKPPHSFFTLVSMAILSSPERKLLLSDIYQYVMDNFPYYNNEQKAWRNCIRHNLSLNECFIKEGRSDSGKGNYWAIHTAVEAGFAKGDFNRRQARLKSRKNVNTVSDASPAPRHDGYVAMTPSHAGYHPNTAADEYTHQEQPVYTHQAKTPLCEQQTNSVTAPLALNYTPVAGHHDIYRSNYQRNHGYNQHCKPVTSTPKSLTSSHVPGRRQLTMA